MWIKLDAILGAVSRLCSRIAVAIAVLMAVVLAVNVALRVFATPILGIVEIISHGMLALIMLALPYTHRIDSHIRIHLLTERLPFRARTSVDAVAQLITAVVTIWIAYMFLDSTLSGGKITSTGLIAIPQLPFRLLVILGFGLWGLEAIAGMIRAVRAFADGAESSSDISGGPPAAERGGMAI